MSSNTEKKRIIHFDLLRIIAAFSVVMLHSAAQFWYSLDIYGEAWIVANSYDAVFRFGVPIFVMLSGALFLRKEYELDIRRLYKHNILRLVILYIVWSCIYGLWDSRFYDFGQIGIKPYIREVIGGRYHLWFLVMITGIYILLPVLKSWLEHAEKKNVQYFLLLFFILQIGGETLRALTVTDELHNLIDLTRIEMACSYIGYFVWGYYLTHVGISEKLCKVFYVCAVPSVVCNVLLGNYLAHRAGKPVGEIYDSFGIFTFIFVTALYLFTVNKVSRISFGDRSAGFIKEVSASTLGVYVMHIGLIEWLETRGIHNMLLPGMIGIPLYALICFMICSLTASVFRRIPLIGKYIC